MVRFRGKLLRQKRGCCGVKKPVVNPRNRIIVLAYAAQRFGGFYPAFCVINVFPYFFGYIIHNKTLSRKIFLTNKVGMLL